MHEDDLALSLDDLARLLTGGTSLTGTLTRVAALAVQAIPGAQGAGLTLLEQDRPQTVIATDPFVHEVDDVQYGLSEGPCLSAVAEGRTFTSATSADSCPTPERSQSRQVKLVDAAREPVADAQGADPSMTRASRDRGQGAERAVSPQSLTVTKVSPARKGLLVADPGGRAPGRGTAERRPV